MLSCPERCAAVTRTYLALQFVHVAFMSGTPSLSWHSMHPPQLSKHSAAATPHAPSSVPRTSGANVPRQGSSSAATASPTRHFLPVAILSACACDPPLRRTGERFRAEGAAGQVVCQLRASAVPTKKCAGDALRLSDRGQSHWRQLSTGGQRMERPRRHPTCDRQWLECTRGSADADQEEHCTRLVTTARRVGVAAGRRLRSRAAHVGWRRLLCATRPIGRGRGYS